MLGSFQQMQLRLEMDATATEIAAPLIHPARWSDWLAPQRFSEGLPDRLTPDLTYTSWIGPIAIVHQVQWIDDRGFCLLLSQGIDGYHEWCWGDGWVQSRLEGVSLLPLKLAHSLSLARLRGTIEADVFTAHQATS